MRYLCYTCILIIITNILPQRKFVVVVAMVVYSRYAFVGRGTTFDCKGAGSGASSGDLAY